MIFLCTNNDKNTEMFKIDDQMKKKRSFQSFVFSKFMLVSEMRFRLQLLERNKT